MSCTPHPEVLIAGAGIVGLSIAMELHHRGHRVTVLERDAALSQASTAAAGMLAAYDPHNPPELLPLAEFSLSLYPGFLDRIQQLSGVPVPFQTDTTVQYAADGSAATLAERSIDPRQLAAALLAAVQNTTIDLREHTSLRYTEEWPRGVNAFTDSGDRFSASQLISTTGAWVTQLKGSVLPIAPRKGQMLRVRLPRSLATLHEVHRNEQIYIVPRTLGPQAGTALIGATVEDAGFDTTVHPSDLAHLRALAAEIFPDLAGLDSAPEVESWAGLRPATTDCLPLMGRIGDSQKFVATGHYRNGILLAPATAVLLADLIEGKPAALDLTPFYPNRFQPSSRTPAFRPSPPIFAPSR